MKEELLLKIREELVSKKEEIRLENEKIKRIKELYNDKNVKEFLSLMSVEYQIPSLIKVCNDDLIISIYKKYIYLIKESETNNLYVYLGTYAYNNDIDIVHGSNDYRVPYDSSNADYRVYQNLELWEAEHVLIKKCDEFEKNNIIINSKNAFFNKQYYEIQKDFFIRAVKVDQEAAKKMILRKYCK